MAKNNIPSHKVSKALLATNLLIALVYFSWWFDFNNASNYWLFGLLFVGEIYHLFMSITFWHTIWPRNKSLIGPEKDFEYFPNVDIFITVAGEPEEVVRRTAMAAKNIDYPNFKVYILNDGFVAKKDNWQEIEDMAKYLDINYITRRVPGGAKAGNVNNALSETNGEMVAIFDADMVPSKNFLKKTVPYFVDSKVGFVQTPQFYENYQENAVTAGSWDQQKLFFGPIMRGKDNYNAAFICGTNVVLRRVALLEVGGMAEDNIAEDFLTSLLIHNNGWISYYHHKVLAKGMAPLDLMSYYKQQLRWARGSLQMLFGNNPLLMANISWHQRIQYLSSALFYFNGVIVLIDIAMPLIYLLTGMQPVKSSTTSFAVYFLPFMFFNLYTLNVASGADISFRTFSFSYSSWYLQLTALFSIIFKKNIAFSITPKQAQSGDFSQLALPHLSYALLVVIGLIVALFREGLNPSITTNVAWALFNVILFVPYVLIALNINPEKVPFLGEKPAIEERTI